MNIDISGNFIFDSYNDIAWSAPSHNLKQY